jgi:hypothetical protein
MTSIFRNIAFGAALGASLFAFQQSFADSATGPKPTTPTPTAQNAGDHHADSTRAVDAAHPAPSGEPRSTAPKLGIPSTNQPPPDRPPPAEQPPPNEGAPLSNDALSKEYQKLSPETRDALMKTLKDKGVDGLSSMSESDARTTFSNLPDNVKQQIQAKWDALSDEQRIALKKMGSDGIKQMFASQMKQMMKQTVMDPVTKPVETVVASTQAVVQKTESALQKSRDYVQKWLAKMRGDQTGQPQDQASQ